mmetsp:Transcript_2964/g.8483  ORF Transcript_2964/g.8483 Transcript_2964/m.8483 type:complete len:363 (+) Transcript_2964:45-1133(+)
MDHTTTPSPAHWHFKQHHTPSGNRPMSFLQHEERGNCSRAFMLDLRLFTMARAANRPRSSTHSDLFLWVRSSNGSDCVSRRSPLSPCTTSGIGLHSAWVRRCGLRSRRRLVRISRPLVRILRLHGLLRDLSVRGSLNGIPSLNLGPWCWFDLLQDVKYFDLGLLQVLWGIQVLHVAHRHVQPVVGPVVLKVVVVRQRILDINAEKNRGLVSPATGHVAQRVSATTKNEGRNAKALHVLNTVSVAFEGKVEASQTVPRERVGTALEHHGPWLEYFHDFANDRPEDGREALVIHAIVQRKVNRVVFALVCTNILHITGSREVLAELVERGGHDSVRRVEGFFNSISMVNVNVDVQDALMMFEEF